MSHISDELYNTRKLEMVMQNVTDLLKSTFKVDFVFPVLGNHDFHPQNDLPGSSNSFYSDIYDMWKNWIPPEATNSFKTGKFSLKSFCRVCNSLLSLFCTALIKLIVNMIAGSC